MSRIPCRLPTAQAWSFRSRPRDPKAPHLENDGKDQPRTGRQAGSQPRTVDLYFKGGTGFNLHMVSSRQWLNPSPLCLLAHPDRHGVILVVNKDSLLFDGGGGGGHQEATSSTVVSVAGSAGFLVAAGGVCPHLASVTVLPEKSILVPPSQGLVRTGGSGHLGLVKEASGDVIPDGKLCPRPRAQRDTETASA